VLTLTIVTPSFNQGTFIERTIDSVLRQRPTGLEYVICDGGSTDMTPEILRRYAQNLRFVSEADGGQADAVNKALRMTTGDVIGWVNSDDIYYPGALAAVLDFFSTHPNVDVVYGDANHIDEKDRVLESYYTEDWNYERLKDVCFICQPTVFFRRSVVERYGDLNATLRYCMDYEYWLRIGRKTPFVRLPVTLAGSRMYATNKTLGSRVAVHTEINDMLLATLGEVPTRWLYNYAFAAYDAQGWDRSALHRHKWMFTRDLAYAYLRWRKTLPLQELWKIAGWFRQSRRIASTPSTPDVAGISERTG
jgi:glycosyltransferase involved in cell wall biosynthesis